MMKVLEGEYLDAGSGDPDLDADFAAFRDEISQGENAEGSVTAYKLPMDATGHVIAKSKKQAFMFTMPIGGVALIDIINRVKREFIRPGEVAITVRLSGNRTGKRGSEFNRVLYIEKENDTAPPSSSTGQPDFVGVLRAMQESMSSQRAESMQFMREIMAMQMRAAPAAAPVAISSSDPLAMMEKMMMMQTMFSKFAPLLGAGAPNAVPAASDPVAQLLGTMKVMREMKSVMGEGAPAEEDSGLMNGLLKLAGPALGLMAENEKTKRALIARGKPALPRAKVAAPIATAEPVVETSAEPATETEADPMSILMFRDQLKALCEMAEEGASPKDAADLVLQQVPEEYDEQLGDLVSDENRNTFATRVGTLFAGCKAHPVWFEELRQHIAAAFDNPDEATH